MVDKYFQWKKLIISPANVLKIQCFETGFVKRTNKIYLFSSKYCKYLKPIEGHGGVSISGAGSFCSSGISPGTRTALGKLVIDIWRRSYQTIIIHCCDLRT